MAISAVDQFGNVQPTYTGTQVLTFAGPANSPGPTSSAPKYPASVTFTNGVASGANAASITLYDAQTTTLTATQVNGSNTYTGSTSSPRRSAREQHAVSWYRRHPLQPPVPPSRCPSRPSTNTTTPPRTMAPASGSASSSADRGPRRETTPPPTPAGLLLERAVVGGLRQRCRVASVTLYDAQTTALDAWRRRRIHRSTAPRGTSWSTAQWPKNLTVSSPGTQTAGTPFNVTLTASDQYGNAGSGTQAITFSGPSSSPSPVSAAPSYPSSVTFVGGTGTANITLYDAQTTTLTATTPLGTSTSPSFTVNAASLTSFSLPTPSTQTAGRAFNESITAPDAYDNTSTGYTGSQTLTFSGPAPSPAPSNQAPSYPSSVSFTNGVGTASVTLYDAQSTTLTATQTSISGSTGSFTVSSGSAAALSIPTTPGGQTAGTAFSLSVGATDTYSNPYSGSLAATFSGPANSPGSSQQSTVVPRTRSPSRTAQPPLR